MIRRNPTRAVTAKDLLRQELGTINDRVVPGLRFEISKTRRGFWTSPRILKPGGKQRNIKVCGITAADLEEAGQQLKAARAAARRIIEDAAAGIDPNERTRIEQRAAQRAREDTFKAFARLYMAEDGNFKVDAAERWRMLEKELFPVFGDWPMRDITRLQVKEYLLAKFAATPKGSEARHIKSLITRIFGHALDEGVVDANVTAGIKLPGRETPRDRYLRAPEIRRFWNGLDDAVMTEQIKLILRLLLVTGQRRGEVVGMHWSELDVEGSLWELPAARTKSRRANRVPLTPLAWEIIHATGTVEGYVFALRAGGEPPVLRSISQAVRRELIVLGLADKPATPHDLRRTAASQMGELGIDRLTISKILNHADPTITGAVYELSEHWEKKRLAMLAWADKLQEIVTGKARPSNVEPLVRAVQ